MLFLLEILTCFFSRFSLWLEVYCQSRTSVSVFLRLLQLHQLLSLRPSSSPPAVLLCPVLVLVLYLYVLVHIIWSFQLAPVLAPILGSNFFRHHALLVDVARARVLDADSLDLLPAVSSPAASDLFCVHLQQAPREI